MLCVFKDFVPLDFTVIGNAFQLMTICIDNKDDPFVSTMFVRSIDGEFFAKSFSENWFHFSNIGLSVLDILHRICITNDNRTNERNGPIDIK